MEDKGEMEIAPRDMQRLISKGPRQKVTPDCVGVHRQQNHIDLFRTNERKNREEGTNEE